MRKRKCTESDLYTEDTTFMNTNSSFGWLGPEFTRTVFKFWPLATTVSGFTNLPNVILLKLYILICGWIFM